MHRTTFCWLLPAACAAAISAAHAQQAPRTAVQSDPLDAKAAVPVLVYRSALSGYRRWSDDEAVPWREANDTVARIGGWRAYAREASELESTGAAATVAPMAAPAASAPSKSMPATHGGHKMH
jgi:hypothetical protein